MYTSRMRTLLAFVLAGLVACGGPTKGPEGPNGGGGGGSGSKPSGPGDVVIEVPRIEVKGTVYEPEALTRPDMQLYEPKRKMTIDQQRKVYEKTKDPVQKEAQAAVLATLLYLKSKEAQGDDQKKLYGDARQVLRDAAQISGDKVDEITLRLLGTYEILLEDYPAAEKAFGMLVTKAPKDKDVINNKAWWGYALLKQHKNAEALQAVGADPISDKQPEHAYVTAWAKFRTGDGAAAWTAILTAAKGWGNNLGRDKLDRELVLFASRTNVPFEKAFEEISNVPPKLSTEVQYQLAANFGTQGYLLAGRWEDGIKALDKALAVMGAKAPVNDVPQIRFLQADFTARLDDPARAAKFAKQAIEALPACANKCKPEEMEAVVKQVLNLGRLFHYLYATAHDDRYYPPAQEIYQLTVPKITIDQKARAEAQQAADFLEKSFKSMKAGVGQHEKQSIGWLLEKHSAEVQACYEQGLGANPKLAGTLGINLETDQTGVIKGVSTEPAPGAEGIALVARCAEKRAKSWKLPTRAQAGTTRVKLTYALNAKK